MGVTELVLSQHQSNPCSAALIMVSNLKQKDFCFHPDFSSLLLKGEHGENFFLSFYFKKGAEVWSS